MRAKNSVKVAGFFAAISLLPIPLVHADIRLDDQRYPEWSVKPYEPKEPREPITDKEPPRETPVPGKEIPAYSPSDNSPGHNSSHEVIAVAVLVLLGACLYHRCWERNGNKTLDSQPSRVTPEIPANEYLRIRQR